MCDSMVQTEAEFRFEALLKIGYSVAGLSQYTEAEVKKLYETTFEGVKQPYEKHHPSQRKIRRGTI